VLDFEYGGQFFCIILRRAEDMSKPIVTTLTFLLMAMFAHPVDISDYTQTILQTNATDPDFMNP
jgi:hypothetical protein